MGPEEYLRDESGVLLAMKKFTAWREKNDLTQAEAAAEMGMPAEMLSRYLNQAHETKTRMTHKVFELTDGYVEPFDWIKDSLGNIIRDRNGN